MFRVKPGPHFGQPAVQMSGLSARQIQIVRQVMDDNRMSSEAYKLRYPSGAFLQGCCKHNGWVLIEFWSADREAIEQFVEYLNRRIFKEGAKK